MRQEKLFEALKKQFTTEPILFTPDLDKKMRMKVDTLDFAMGGVLSMKCNDGKWKLVAYLSKSLNKIKRNYKIHNKEMFVVLSGLEN